MVIKNICNETIKIHRHGHQDIVSLISRSDDKQR